MTSRTMRGLSLGGGFVALLLIVLYSAGAFTTGKVAPGREAPSPAPAALLPSAKAELGVIEELYEAMGTVRPLSEATVEAQIPGRVLRVEVRPGQRVAKGQALVVLEDQQPRARAEQARQGLAAAKANQERARAEYERVKGFAAAEAATAQNLEQARAGFLAAEAGARQAQKMLEEAGVGLGQATVSSPAEGVVVRRMVEPGDLALPGRPLLLVQTTGGYRLEALVREGAADKITPGRELTVEVPALSARLRGRVEEVSPAADPQTRSFLVKVGLESAPGLKAGMFGRLLVPLGQRPAVLAPPQAIGRVGQLEMVEVVDGGGTRRVHVRSGRSVGDKVEVLSGLKGGESLVLRGAGHE